MKKIVRSIIFTVADSEIKKEDRQAIAGFLGDPQHEKKLFEIVHAVMYHDAEYACELPLLLQTITPPGKTWRFFRGSRLASDTKGMEEWVLAETE